MEDDFSGCTVDEEDLVAKVEAVVRGLLETVAVDGLGSEVFRVDEKGSLVAIVITVLRTFSLHEFSEQEVTVINLVENIPFSVAVVVVPLTL